MDSLFDCIMQRKLKSSVLLFGEVIKFNIFNLLGSGLIPSALILTAQIVVSLFQKHISVDFK